jgi:predicted HTH transcriptional regulator
MVELNDEELLLRLNNFEDNFVERKTSGDSKDWLKTVVAFANSTPIGHPAVLYIGVKNDGSPEEKTVDLDSLQKKFAEKVTEVYPLPYYLTKVLPVDAKQVLTVIVPGSPHRPHFAGQAYTREGSRTVVASKLQFEELIASRNSKVYEILKWKDKNITVATLGVAWPGQQFFSIVGREVGMVAACNQFYVTLEFPGGKKKCIPLGRTDVSFDTGAGRLELEARLD